MFCNCFSYQYRCAGVAGALGGVPEDLIGLFEFVEFERSELVGATFDFLEAEDVGRVLGEEVLEGVFFKDGAESVDVPREESKRSQGGGHVKTFHGRGRAV